MADSKAGSGRSFQSDNAPLFGMYSLKDKGLYPPKGWRGKVLFLDVDGVLNGATCPPEHCISFLGLSPLAWMDRRQVALLSAYLADHTDVYIVVSSTWRRLFSKLDALQAFFPTVLSVDVDRVVGATPQLIQRKISLPVTRSAEVLPWLKLAKAGGVEVSAWAALDDEHGPDYDEGGMWVQIDGTAGLTAKDMEKIEFKEQQSRRPRQPPMTEAEIRDGVLNRNFGRKLSNPERDDVARYYCELLCRDDALVASPEWVLIKEYLREMGVLGRSYPLPPPFLPITYQ